MPTYEYVCTECATPLEVVAAFTDPPLTQCPSCGGRLRKVFGNVGVVFKGSGFYRTDSRSKTAKSPSSSSTPAEKSPSATGTESSPKAGSNGSSSSTSTAATPAKTAATS